MFCVLVAGQAQHGDRWHETAAGEAYEEDQGGVGELQEVEAGAGQTDDAAQGQGPETRGRHFVLSLVNALAFIIIIFGAWVGILHYLW